MRVVLKMDGSKIKIFVDPESPKKRDSLDRIIKEVEYGGNSPGGELGEQREERNAEELKKLQQKIKDEKHKKDADEIAIAQRKAFSGRLPLRGAASKTYVGNKTRKNVTTRKKVTNRQVQEQIRRAKLLSQGESPNFKNVTIRKKGTKGAKLRL